MIKLREKGPDTAFVGDRKENTVFGQGYKAKGGFGNDSISMMLAKREELHLREVRPFIIRAKLVLPPLL